MSLFLDGCLLEFKTYPNGEVIVPTLSRPITRVRQVRLHWTGDEDFARLALVAGLLRQQGRKADLVIDYMPYSRMDREQDGHCYSLRYVAELINAMHFEKVFVVEPHSEQTLLLLKDSEPIWATAKLVPVAMKMIPFRKVQDYLVLPDDGAFSRYSELVPELSQCNVVILKKNRDFSTGKILGLEIDRRILRGSSIPISGSKALIIDDLSSRGGTFVAAAELLRRQVGISDVSLLVTHMEPAGLQGELRHKLNRVFCTDTMEFLRPLPGNFELLPRSYWL